jgi:hypothetical protein
MKLDDETGGGAEQRPEAAEAAAEQAAGTDDTTAQEPAGERTQASQTAGLTELVAGMTGIAQDRLARLRDDVIARGEATREGFQRSAFRALFPNEATRLDELERRLELVEGRLTEPGGKLTPDSKRRTGFASTAEVPDEKVDTPG